MIGWAKTTDGWALNVDGTDAATRFAFPRLELHCGARGWQCRCLLANGTSHGVRGPSASLTSAKRATLERARAVLGAAYAGALDELLGAE
jgi:hypothetical protein